MNIKDEIKIILIMFPAGSLFMFGLDYFFIKEGEFGLLVILFIRRQLT